MQIDHNALKHHKRMNLPTFEFQTITLNSKKSKAGVVWQKNQTEQKPSTSLSLVKMADWVEKHCFFFAASLLHHSPDFEGKLLIAEPQ
tara:strand:- start:498 stop:761 length:264 start_codon:yes stop_codon:yes gene_type:complete